MEIFCASALGERTRVAALLKESPALARAMDPDGKTALHLAARQGQKEVMELLLAGGADVNARDSHGSTPLPSMVLECTRTDVADLLLAWGADLAARDHDGNTPLVVAASCIHRPGHRWGDHATLARFLLERGAALDLFAAAMLNRSEEAVALLRAEPGRVHARRKGHCLPSGATPLHSAADRGHREVARALLEHGADVNATDARGRPTLYLAAHDAGTRKMAPSPEVVELLLSHGAPLDIFAGAVLGRIDRVTELLETDPARVNARDKGGSTPLHLAAWNGQEEMVELLLARGAEIDALNQRGETPLALATIYRHKEVVRRLLQRGARCDLFTAVALGKLDQIAARLKEQPGLIHARNRYGATPLGWTRWCGFCSVEAGPKEVVELLLQHGAEPDRIGRLAGLGQWDQVAALLQAEPDRIPTEGGRLLHRAVGSGRRDAVELLLECGVPLEAKGHDGVTPLHAAVWNGQKEIAELLVSRGANVNTRSNWNDPVLREVVGQGWPDLAERMLACGARLEIGIAAALGTRDEVDSMLQADPRRVNARDAGDRTPLHHAAGRGHREVAELLLQWGADANARAEGEFGRGITPLHTAALGGHLEVVKLLLEHGADINARNHAGDGPLALAVRGDHHDVAGLLRQRGATA
jgi:ankyrin repeat protein